MKKITQFKKDNNIKTTKDPTPRNKFRKRIKGKTNSKLVKAAREKMFKRSIILSKE
jgi:hypothetical protein